jgi:hypothetical protein
MSRVSRGTIEVERFEQCAAGIAYLVLVTVFDQQQRASAQRMSFTLDDGLTGTLHNEQPLVRPSMPVARPTLSVTGRDDHHGCLRAGVSECDPKTLSESELLTLHIRLLGAGYR